MKCHCNEIEELRERIDELEAAAAYSERQLDSDRRRLAKFRRMYWEVGSENVTLRSKLAENEQAYAARFVAWGRAQERADKAEAKLAKIEALVQREEQRMAAGPVLFDGSHFPAVVTAGELREVLDA